MPPYHFSVIIPHKNIPDLLQRCLDSIPLRDDLQIIIVDDNSNPVLVDFEQFPGLNRANTEVYFDKTGKGAGHARNIGIEHAKGTWLLFADADDFFNYCLGSFLDDYRDSDSDVVFCNANSCDCQLYTNANRCLLTNDLVRLYETNSERAEFLFRYHQGVPWSKIVKTSLVRYYGLRFDETPICNDTTFAYQSGYVAKKISVDNRAVYCVTMRGDSITYTMNREKFLAIIEVFSRKYRYLLDRGIDLWEYTIPENMKLAKMSDQTLYLDGLKEMRKYGLSKADLDKSYFIFREKVAFKDTIEYKELSASYDRYGFSFRLVKYILSLIRILVR